MPKNSSRAYPAEFIIELISEYEKREESIAAIAETYGVPFNTLKFWIKEYHKKGYEAFIGNNKRKHHQTYAGSFKQRVISYWCEHPELSQYAVAERFSVGRNAVRNWKKIYDEKGYDGLLHEKRGVKKDFRKKMASVKEDTDQTAKIRILEEEVEYLRAENEYLKKLNALTREKASQNNHTR